VGWDPLQPRNLTTTVQHILCVVLTTVSTLSHLTSKHTCSPGRLREASPTARTAIRGEAGDCAESRNTAQHEAQLEAWPGGTDSPPGHPHPLTLFRFRGPVPVSEGTSTWVSYHRRTVPLMLVCTQYTNLSPSSRWHRTVGTHCRVPHQGASPTSRKTHGAHPTSYDRFSGQSLLVLPPSTSILAQPPPPFPRAGNPDRPRLCVPMWNHGVQPILRGRCSLLRDHARLLGLSTVRVQQSLAEKIMAPLIWEYLHVLCLFR
jgi:hypothetical protein